jgi:hypothetical protein
MVRKKLLSVLAPVVLVGTAHAYACDQPIVLSNWKSCAVGAFETDGDADWKAVPKRTRSEDLRPWFMEDPRLLANRGLCNAKFQRVVLRAETAGERREGRLLVYDLLLLSGAPKMKRGRLK